jgi:hypothetical protein
MFDPGKYTPSMQFSNSSVESADADTQTIALSSIVRLTSSSRHENVLGHVVDIYICFGHLLRRFGYTFLRVLKWNSEQPTFDIGEQ